MTILNSASAAHWPVLQIGLPGREAYCKRWGYNLVVNRLPDPYQPRRMAQILEIEDDWVCFMGADTLITNHTICLQDLLVDGAGFVIGADPNGINNDVFLLRLDTCGKAFIWAVIAQLAAGVENDQIAMANMIGLISHQIVPQRHFNSYLRAEYGPKDDEEAWAAADWKLGDFCLHLPALSIERRIERLTEYLTRVLK